MFNTSAIKSHIFPVLKVLFLSFHWKTPFIVATPAITKWHLNIMNIKYIQKDKEFDINGEIVDRQTDRH